MTRVLSWAKRVETHRAQKVILDKTKQRREFDITVSI